MPFGWIGVAVFFVISGLVIAQSARAATVRSFATRRFLRLYPGAWCATILGAFILVLCPARYYKLLGIHVQLSLRGLLDSFTLVGIHFLSSAYWTLPIELSFYFLILLAIAGGRIARIEWLSLALILWSSIYFLPHVSNVLGLTHLPSFSLGYGGINLTLLRYGVFFALGMLVWLMMEKRITTAGWIALGIALALAAVEIDRRAAEVAPMLARSARQTTANTTGLAVASCVVFYLAFLAILLSVHFNRRFPTNQSLRGAVRMLGLATYPFYLLHESVGGLVLTAAIAIRLPFLLGVFAALAVIGAISLLIAGRLEPALRGWLRRLMSSPGPSANAAA
jgi:peptidoglycan/LPS O-acetylase OafA/YrhL